MKTLFRIVVVALLTGVAFQVNSAAYAKTITVAYPSPSWNTSLPVSTARDFGIFAAEGLDVRPVYVRGGPVVMAALLSGEADYQDKLLSAMRFGFGGHLEKKEGKTK